MKLPVVVGSLVLSLVALGGRAGSAHAQAPARTETTIRVPPKTASWTLQTADYTETQVQGDQVVRFTGDELAAPAGGAYGMTVRRPPGILRAGLLRPRVNFFPELLRSVENL